MIKIEHEKAIRELLGAVTRIIEHAAVEETATKEAAMDAAMEHLFDARCILRDLRVNDVKTINTNQESIRAADDGPNYESNQ